MYKEKGHFVIIGWSSKAKYAVKEMLDTDEICEIVLIDQLNAAPVLAENIHYIKGDASDLATLQKANVPYAKAVIVFADEQADKQTADGKTLLIASSIESISTHVHTIVEVMDEKHIPNFKHADVDEFIVSNEMISSLAVRSAFRKGVTGIYGQLLRRSVGEDLFHVPVRSNWKKYRDAFEALLNEGATLIADRNDLAINRKLEQELPEDAELYVVCDKKHIITSLQKGNKYGFQIMERNVRAGVY